MKTPLEILKSMEGKRVRYTDKCVSDPHVADRNRIGLLEDVGLTEDGEIKFCACDWFHIEHPNAFTTDGAVVTWQKTSESGREFVRALQPAEEEPAQ